MMKKYLNEIFLFKRLNSSHKDKLLTLATVRELEAGEILFYQGDASSQLHIILEGQIEIYKVNSSGKKISLKYFADYELIAEFSNYKNMPFPATAEALKRSKIMLIDFKKFKEHFFSNPIVVANMLESMSDKIINFEKLISTHLTMNATQRLSYYLMENKIDLNRQKHIDIAQELHISPVSLSRIIKKLKDQKAIAFTHNVYTIDKKVLKNFLS